MPIEERFWSRYAFWVTTYAKPPLFFGFVILCIRNVRKAQKFKRRNSYEIQKIG